MSSNQQNNIFIVFSNKLSCSTTGFVQQLAKKTTLDALEDAYFDFKLFFSHFKKTSNIIIMFYQVQDTDMYKSDLKKKGFIKCNKNYNQSFVNLFKSVKNCVTSHFPCNYTF